MDLKTLLHFVELEHARLRKRHPATDDPEKRILAHSVKLAEEVGELSDAVLAFLNLQRKAKIAEKGAGDIAGEFADVIIVALLLAKDLGIPVEDALEKKMAKINARSD